MVATYSLFYPEDYAGVARMDDNNTRVIDTDDGIRAATDEEVEEEDPRIRGIREGEPLAALPRKLNLNNLTFHLPFDKVEYEPEQEGDIDAFLAVPARHARTRESLLGACVSSGNVFSVWRFH